MIPRARPFKGRRSAEDDAEGRTHEGRFTQEDLLHFDADGDSWYAYAANAPSIYQDPTGLDVWLCTRPLNFLRKQGWAYKHWGLAHWYLWDDPYGEGYGWDHGPMPLGFGFGFDTVGRLLIEPTKTGSCTPLRVGPECEKCVHDRAISWGIRQNALYRINTFDCTDWVWKVLDECDKPCCPKRH